MKHKSNAPDDFCTCPYCSAHYYGLSLFKKALDETTTEDDLCQKVYAPLARICIPKYRWSAHELIGYFDDARALAIEQMFLYGRRHTLTPDEQTLWALIKVAKASASKILEDFDKHVRPFTIIDYHDTDDSNHENRQSHLTGRRVYLPETSDNNEDGSMNLIDRVAPKNTEDSTIATIDNRKTCEHHLKDADSKAIVQIVANLALKMGIIHHLLKRQKDVVASGDIVSRIEEDLVPLAVEAGLGEKIAHDFCKRALEVLPPKLSLTKLKNKAYNRRQYHQNLFTL